jgi:hypothetical protein
LSVQHVKKAIIRGREKGGNADAVPNQAKWKKNEKRKTEESREERK